MERGVWKRGAPSRAKSSPPHQRQIRAGSQTPETVEQRSLRLAPKPLQPGSRPSSQTRHDTSRAITYNVRLGSSSSADSVELTSMLLNTFPFHSLCHSLALFAFRNFIRTIYRFARAVRIMRKWLTWSIVDSPTNPRKSDGDKYAGTASTQSVVQSSSGCIIPLLAIGAWELPLPLPLPLPLLPDPAAESDTDDLPTTVLMTPPSP